MIFCLSSASRGLTLNVILVGVGVGGSATGEGDDAARRGMRVAPSSAKETFATFVDKKLELRWAMPHAPRRFGTMEVMLYILRVAGLSLIWWLVGGGGGDESSSN